MRLLKSASTFIFLIAIVPVSFSQPASHKEKFLDVSGIDSTYQPGDDFYRFANGKWLNTTTRPASGYIVQMGNMMASNDSLMRKLLTAVYQGRYNNVPAGKQLHTFYVSATDTIASPLNGLKTVQEGLDAIRQINSKVQLQAYLVRQLLLPANKLIGLWPNEEETKATVQIEFTQAGLGMPLKNYAIQQPANITLRAGYTKLLQKLFHYAGSDTTTARQRAARVLAVEDQLAAFSDSTDSRSQFSYQQLEATYPELPFNAIFAEFGLPRNQPFFVWHKSYYAGLNQLLSSISIEDWKLKLQADYLLFNAPYLPTPIASAHTDFYERQLKNEPTAFNRQTQLRELFTNLWASNNLADVLGDLYAHIQFTAPDRSRLYVLANSIRAAFARRIESADWLENKTRQSALRKLNALYVKVGYPDSVNNSSLIFSGTNFLANVQKVYEHNQRSYLRSAGQLKRQTDWRRSQWSVASTYQPQYNSFIVVTGLLKPPYYYPNGDDAINYGAIGSIIAHEFTHGFDNNGILFNDQGVKSAWFTSKDSLAFRKRINPLVAQFNQYVLFDTTHLNGELSLGETTADLVGLSLAYDAFKTTNQYKANKPTNGLTPTQRFLLAYAQQWRALYSDTFLKDTFREVPWPLEEFRINGTLTHFTPFYEAFGVKPGHKLYRTASNRVRVW
jgi:putative endopeptidase